MRRLYEAEDLPPMKRLVLSKQRTHLPMRGPVVMNPKATIKEVVPKMAGKLSRPII